METQFSQLLRLIDTAGTIALLVMVAHGFYSGRLVSRQTVREVIAAVLDELERNGWTRPNQR